MVAKSYQELKIVEQPYALNGRQYVKVQTKKGTLKQVRWYTETEYNKMYNKKEEDPSIHCNQKKVLGFDKGYITIFKGGNNHYDEYFMYSPARYTRWWGWYFRSIDELPNDLPDYVEPIQLPWELVAKDETTLKPEDQVIEAVNSLLYEPDESEYQGSVGDRLELVLTVEQAHALDGYYGPHTMHIMRDYDGNCYIWTTAAKNWAVGTEHHLAGTVKQHKTYKNIKQTILTRCREIED